MLEDWQHDTSRADTEHLISLAHTYTVTHMNESHARDNTTHFVLIRSILSLSHTHIPSHIWMSHMRETTRHISCCSITLYRHTYEWVMSSDINVVVPSHIWMSHMRETTRHISCWYVASHIWMACVVGFELVHSLTSLLSHWHTCLLLSHWHTCLLLDHRHTGLPYHAVIDIRIWMTA